MTVVWLVVAGLIVGLLGRLVHPGPDAIGWVATIVTGVVSMLLVGLLLDGLGFWGDALAVVVAAVLVAIVGRLVPADRGGAPA